MSSGNMSILDISDRSTFVPPGQWYKGGLGVWGFRYYSNHWRTWGACFIQSAWRKYQRRRLAELRRKEEDQYLALQAEPTDKVPSLGATLLAGKFAKNAMRGVQRLRSMHAAELTRISNIPKPSEPDFSQEHWTGSLSAPPERLSEVLPER
jgi:hypothetical protein